MCDAVPDVPSRRDAVGVVRVTTTDAPALPLVEDAAETLRESPTVVDAAIIHEDKRCGGRRTLRLVLERDVVRVPPGVLKELYDHDLGVADVTPQGGFLTVLAT
ncbi:hypothetical protein HRTV-28_gp47 [Halorubrum tailed virus 28]|uniref:Uncharacterized protein n=1 Tax=Halorubrum tailed virus 28 TaxID=2878009 RepID=A0AAE9BYD4_9CAUD|nr:hypothetical protein M1M39_gp48 [Halorubrum tailed virus 28]UBF23485.1 hypothetical protein HRTV-28_gp47 [Halorubrum tailed virus 28]